MATEKELLEKRARDYNVMTDLHKRAKDEERNLSADEQAQWDKANESFDALTKQIEEIRESQKVDGRMAAIDAQLEAEERNFSAPEQKVSGKVSEGPSYDELFLRWATGTPMYDFTREERSILAQNQTTISGAELRGTSTQIGATDSLGGYLIPRSFSNELEATLEYVGGALNAVRRFTSNIGGTLHWPTVDDTATDSNWITEGQAVTVQDMTFGETTFSDYTLASQTKMSVQLLNDESVLQSTLATLLGERHNRALNIAITTGNGSGKPTGFTTYAVTEEAAAAAALTRDDLVNVQHAVDPAYQMNGAYMFNDSTLAYIKKLALGSGDDRPLWQPSIREGAPDRLEGKPYVLNQAMSDIGTGNDSVFFGDWSKYILRQVGGLSLIRLNERYMDALSVGFILYGRYDGKLINTAALAKINHADT